MLAGSYYNYAVLEPDQITVTYPHGSFEVRDWNYKITPHPQIRGDVLESVIKENSEVLLSMKQGILILCAALAWSPAVLAGNQDHN